MDSYDVRFWDIKKLGNGTAARYRVRWAVDGREHCKSFKARPLADGFLDRPEGRGPRPAALQPPHRPARRRGHRRRGGHLVRPRPRLHRGQVGEPRPGLAPVGRRGPGHRHHRPHREGAGRARPEGAAAGAVRLGVQPRHPRHHPAAPRSPPPSTGPNAPRSRSPSWKTPRLCGWRWPPAPRPWPASRRPGRPSGASGRCSTTPSATPSNSGPSARTRSTGSSGPPPPSPQSVDRRVVVSPAQAGTLLAAAGRLGQRGEHLEAFFASPLLRGAAPVGGGHAPRGRPAPAEDRVGTDRPVGLRIAGRAGLDRRRHRPPGTRPEAPRRQRDPHHPHPARSWSGCSARTSSGSARPSTGGSSRPPGAASCRIPATTRSGTEARREALTPAQYRSPLGRRPYDLRHAAVSLWLNSGVPATEVARRAGHGVAVLLKIYAHCIDGQATAANQRIADALGIQDAEARPR